MGSPPTRRGRHGSGLQAAMEGLARIDHALQHGNVLIGCLATQMQALVHASAGSCNRWISVQSLDLCAIAGSLCNTVRHSRARPCERGMRLGMIWQRGFAREGSCEDRF